MVHLIRLCLHFGVSHPGAQVVDLAQADSREEARNLAMALARIAPRRISARVIEFGLAHRRAEQEKQRHGPDDHRLFAPPRGASRELFEFGLQGRASRMQMVRLGGEGGEGDFRRKYRVLKLKHEWTTSLWWGVESCLAADRRTFKAVLSGRRRGEASPGGVARCDGPSPRGLLTRKFGNLYWKDHWGSVRPRGDVRGPMEGAPLRCLCRVVGCLGAPAGRVRSARLWSLPPLTVTHRGIGTSSISGSVVYTVGGFCALCRPPVSKSAASTGPTGSTTHGMPFFA
jgi:hypothetical protein